MVTVSWVTTASSNTVESNTLLHRPDNTPVSATTARTASNTRSGALLRRSRARHKVNTVGWNPSSVNAKPAAAFQRISQRNRPIASRSDSPSNACNTNTVATTKSRYRRTTPTTEQIPEQPVGEHPPPMHSQKPVNRPHAANINALAAANVTRGCAANPARYCPGQPVTRVQMITFIARALRLIPLPPVVKEATERIAFTFKGNVFVMEADGDNQQQLAFNDRKATNTNCCPIWLSDDKRVAFTRYHFPRDGDWDVFTMGADGGNQQRVGGNPYDYNDPESNNLWFKPALSPYGNRIAFAGYRGGDYEIFVMDAASGDLKQLTQNSRHDIEPVWSPDGARIAFTRSGEGIFVMDADGGNQTRLQGGDSPVWSPDGARIALRGNLGNSSEIFVVDADGNNSLNLTNDPLLRMIPPPWSPDGSQHRLHSSRQSGTVHLRSL